MPVHVNSLVLCRVTPPFSVPVVGKFSTSGRDDFAVSNQQDHTVSLLFNNGDGRFSPSGQSPFPVRAGPPNSAPEGMAGGIFTSSGLTGFVVANNGDFPNGSISVFINNGDNTFTLPASREWGMA